MVENSIDAKATLVTVNLRNGGLALIEVIDNGSGIEVRFIECSDININIRTGILNRIEQKKIKRRFRIIDF